MSSPRKQSNDKLPGGGSSKGGASKQTSRSSTGGDGGSKQGRGPKLSRPPSTSSTSSTSSADTTRKPPQKGAKNPSQKDTLSGAKGSDTSGPPFEKKKPLTKAERRELQEAQRRAKAEKEAVTGKGATSGEGASVSSKPSLTATGKPGSTEGGGHDGRRRRDGASVSSKPNLSATGKAGSTEGGGHGDHGGHSKATGQRGTSHKITKSSSQDKPPQKQVQLFSHLPQYERALPPTKSLDSTVGTIPACIVKLGLQYSEGIICGSNARCIALLAAFKKVIRDYSTPPEKELRRDLDATIKPYITFLAKCRPLSVSMGNAIKHLKLKISNIPPDQPEAEAKESLSEAIDDYLKEKIHLADKAILEYCQNIIKDGDVILVHAYSSIVQKALVDAHNAGKQFRVIVVDSRPKLEGQHCLRQLVQSGIKCSYVFINAVSYIMKEVSKVIVGAHGLLANGYVMSRVGTSLIALVARSYNVPFLVCCETYKFCDKVQTDSFVINELGDPNDLVSIHKRQGDYLTHWKSIEALRLLNLVYDVTSPDFITMVITQVGLIPCTSVPVVLRISQDIEQMQAT